MLLIKHPTIKLSCSQSIDFTKNHYQKVAIFQFFYENAELYEMFRIFQRKNEE